MAEKIGSRQQQILDLLLANKAGLSIDAFAAALKISRTAVQQHLGNLERLGYIRMGTLKQTAGRPVRTFVLTEGGLNSFPKQYAWFCELVCADLIEAMGPDAFTRFMHKLGDSLAQKLLPRLAGLPTRERIAALLQIMDELGFQTKELADPSGNDTVITASNCIYHDLAQQHQEICEFDRTLIAALLESDIEHLECMAKGCATCSFKILKASE
jgi:DeoR family transcriptional regulator, suf operon transcriptional repressor